MGRKALDSGYRPSLPAHRGSRRRVRVRRLEEGRDRRGRDDRRGRRRRAFPRPRRASRSTPDVVKPLAKPVTVTYDGKKYILTPGEARRQRRHRRRWSTQAFEASREGGLPTRVWRYATGGEVDREHRADRLLRQGRDRRVRRHQSPGTSTRSPRTQASTPGRPASASRRARAARRFAPTSCGSRSPRRSRPRARGRSPPRSTRSSRTSPRAEVAAQYPTYMIVDRSAFTLSLCTTT